MIEATITNGKFKGKYVLIPLIPSIPTDLPSTFKRLQFSVHLTFKMTVKAQEQLMCVVRLNLENPYFSHNQLYID